MRFLLNSIFIVLILASFSRCGKKIKSQHEDNFCAYMDKNWNFGFQENTDQHFIVIPGQGCSQCAKDLEEIYLRHRHRRGLYLVASKGYVSDSLKQSSDPKIYIDKTGKLKRLDMGTSASLFITVTSHEVTSIIPVTINNIDSLRMHL